MLKTKMAAPGKRAQLRPWGAAPLPAPSPDDIASPAGPRSGTAPVLGDRSGLREPPAPLSQAAPLPPPARGPERPGPIPAPRGARPGPYLQLGPFHLPVRPLHLEASPLVLDVVQDPRDGVVLRPGQLGRARRLLPARGRGALRLLLPSAAGSGPRAAPARLQVHVASALRRGLLRPRRGRHPAASSGSRVLVHCLRGALLLVPRREPGTGAGEGASGAGWDGWEEAGRVRGGGGPRRAVSGCQSSAEPPPAAITASRPSAHPPAPGGEGKGERRGARGLPGSRSPLPSASSSRPVEATERACAYGRWAPYPGAGGRVLLAVAVGAGAWRGEAAGACRGVCEASPVAPRGAVLRAPGGVRFASQVGDSRIGWLSVFWWCPILTVL